MIMRLCLGLFVRDNRGGRGGGATRMELTQGIVGEYMACLVAELVGALADG